MGIRRPVLGFDDRAAAEEFGEEEDQSSESELQEVEAAIGPQGQVGPGAELLYRVPVLSRGREKSKYRLEDAPDDQQPPDATHIPHGANTEEVSRRCVRE